LNSGSWTTTKRHGWARVMDVNGAWFAASIMVLSVSFGTGFASKDLVDFLLFIASITESMFYHVRLWCENTLKVFLNVLFKTFLFSI
jgi:hypothetical protein